MDKEKKPVINEINKKLHSVHTRLDSITKDLEIIKKHVIETNYKVPERKAGWLYDTWSSPTKLSKEEWEKLQK